MSGWDVQTLQIAINGSTLKPDLVEDGSFGSLTESAVRKTQTNLGITVDGIAGPQTQMHLCARECESIHNCVPKGLLKGICFGESGGIIPATSSIYPNGSRDYGPLQDNLTNPSQTRLRGAFNVALQARVVGHEINTTFNRLHGMLGAHTNEQAWRLAIAYYNWPAGANAIARGERDTWVYVSNGKHYKLEDPAPWVEQYHVSGVRTGLEWINFYVNSKITYVNSWTIS